MDTKLLKSKNELNKIVSEIQSSLWHSMKLIHELELIKKRLDKIDGTKSTRLRQINQGR